MSKSTWIVALALFAVHALIGGLLPLTLDEAYYLQWSRALAWGYLDHPPGVALLGVLASITGNTAPLIARAGTLLCGLGAMILTVRVAVRLFACDAKTQHVVLLWMGASIGGLGASILTTPDAALILCWTLALHEAVAAHENPRRWLTCGLAIGAGLLSKYMMILFVPPLLWYLWRWQRPVLRSRWFMLGATITVLTFAPHLAWNSSHDWASIRFQLMRGFTGTHKIQLNDAGYFPAVSIATAGSPEAKFSDFSAPDPKTVKAPVAKSTLQKVGERVGNFVGGQLALWGLLLIPLLLALRRNLRQENELSDTRRSLLIYLAVFPLLFFGVISLAAKVEPNWPAMYMVSATILLAQHARHLGINWTLAAANCLLIVAAVAVPHSKFASRLTRETLVMPALIAKASALVSTDTVYAANYQIAATWRLYNPQNKIDQWPGLARRSELTRNDRLQDLGPPSASTQVFWLISEDRHAPQIAGYTLHSMRSLTYCTDPGALEIVGSLRRDDYYRPPCAKKALSTWYLLSYAPSLLLR